MGTKQIGILLIIAGLAFAIGRMTHRILIANDYANKAGSYWTLADKASTLAQKREYIDKYVGAVESHGLSGLNANWILVKPSTAFDENLKAVKSLQSRLAEISGMDEKDFAYQSAIQQITSQEQGEGDAVFDNIYECWQQKNHYTYWNPLLIVTFFAIQFLLVAIGATLLNE